MRLTDARGRRFDFARPPRRVVSLVPSLTESLFAIGAGGSLAGVTNFCIFPEHHLPRLGGTKNPRVDQIRALQPDLVYVNIEENLPRHAEAIETFAPVFATHPKTVAEVIELLETLGRIHHCEAAASRHAERIGTAAKTKVKPFRFACAIWKDPWMWCGGDTYVSDLICTAGGENVFAGALRYPAETVESVFARGPDIIFLPDEPYLFTEADASLLRASGARDVIGPFPGHLFTWHGVRTLRGLEFLHEALRNR